MSRHTPTALLAPTGLPAAATMRHAAAGVARSLLTAACALGLLVAGSAQGQTLGTIRFDNWLYYQNNIGSTERWQYRPRVFVPFNLSGGWSTTSRADFPVFYTDATGPENPDGGWKLGIGDFFVEQNLVTPQLAPNFRLVTSLRLVFPTGGSAPFGSDQYQWALALGANYSMPERGIGITPLARWFQSYHATEPGAAQIKRLDLFPGVQFALPNDWTLAFYPENPISYNDITNKWFVPIDLLLVRQLTKTVEVGFGGAYALVKDFPQYQYIINGRVTFFF